MSATTATVEVLTAEVRVLMVGSRQVTMSVYNQLDTVRWHEIEAFGRIRGRDAESGFTDVIGRSRRPRDEGALVRSRAPMAACIQSLRKHGWTSNSGGYSYPLWQQALKDAEICSRLEALAPQWEALPLIVLAGLR